MPRLAKQSQERQLREQRADQRLQRPRLQNVFGMAAAVDGNVQERPPRQVPQQAGQRLPHSGNVSPGHQPQHDQRRFIDVAAAGTARAFAGQALEGPRRFIQGHSGREHHVQEAELDVQLAVVFAERIGVSLGFERFPGRQLVHQSDHVGEQAVVAHLPVLKDFKLFYGKSRARVWSRCSGNGRSGACTAGEELGDRLPGLRECH